MKKAFIFVFLLFALILFYGWATAECLIIVNKSVSETLFTGKDVKLIFLGKKIKWGDGTKIHKAGLIKGPVHEELLRKYIHKSPSSYSSFWKLMIVTGGGIPPRSFRTEEDVVKYVAVRPGTIGYISSDTKHNGVKVLSIE